ncbi:unnamed protein product [Ixodes persulcatus]
MIHAAVRFNFKEGTTSYLINDVTKKWLNNASDRNGGSCERRKRVAVFQ